jgi:RimJ/RimL family protein N-acetyltransferase
VPVPYQLSDAQAFVSELAPAHWQNERGAPFAVTDAATGAGLGSIGLVVHDLASGVAEAGYWTTPTARGKGVTTAALMMLTDFAFQELGLVRLELLVEVENATSKAVAERAGYVFEGVLTKKVWKNGAHRDVAIYARIV